MALLACLFAAPPAIGLTDEEIFRDFRFNLINPGARSLALGGAFISLADDATAAQANPAGLSILEKSEYFAELRLVDNGAQSSVVNETLPSNIRTFVATATDIDDVTSPTFLSAVTKFDRWALGVSVQEVINTRNETLSSFAFTFPDSVGAFLTEGAGRIDVEARNVNVGVGVRVTDRFRVGGTLTYSKLDVDAEVVNMIVDTGGTVAGQEILEPTLDLRTSIRDSDEDVTFSVGTLYKRLDKEKNVWSVGAVYRKAPRFRVAESVDPAGLDVFDQRARLGERFSNRFSFPDVFGVGASLQPNDKLTFSLDVERVFYANLLDGFVAGVNVLTTEDAEFTVDDATDVRFGVEYLVFPKGGFVPAVALRAGAFTEAPSTIRATSTGSGSFATEDVFEGRDRETHLTMGAGIPFGPDARFKLDVAADFSESTNEYLLSFIYQVTPK